MSPIQTRTSRRGRQTTGESCARHASEFEVNVASLTTHTPASLSQPAQGHRLRALPVLRRLRALRHVHAAPGHPERHAVVVVTPHSPLRTRLPLLPNHDLQGERVRGAKRMCAENAWLESSPSLLQDYDGPQPILPYVRIPTNPSPPQFENFIISVGTFLEKTALRNKAVGPLPPSSVHALVYPLHVLLITFWITLIYLLTIPTTVYLAVKTALLGSNSTGVTLSQLLDTSITPTSTGERKPTSPIQTSAAVSNASFTRRSRLVPPIRRQKRPPRARPRPVPHSPLRRHGRHPVHERRRGRPARRRPLRSRGARHVVVLGVCGALDRRGDGVGRGWVRGLPRGHRSRGGLRRENNLHETT